MRFNEKGVAALNDVIFEDGTTIYDEGLYTPSAEEAPAYEDDFIASVYTTVTAVGQKEVQSSFQESVETTLVTSGNRSQSDSFTEQAVTTLVVASEMSRASSMVETVVVSSTAEGSKAVSGTFVESVVTSIVAVGTAIIADTFVQQVYTSHTAEGIKEARAPPIVEEVDTTLVMAGEVYGGDYTDSMIQSVITSLAGSGMKNSSATFTQEVQTQVVAEGLKEQVFTMTIQVPVYPVGSGRPNAYSNFFEHVVTSYDFTSQSDRMYCCRATVTALEPVAGIQTVTIEVSVQKCPDD